MITPNTVADRLGLPDPDDKTTRRWQLYIAAAYRQIERYRELHSLPEPNAEDLDYVVLEVVAALVNRPDDATTVDISVDDGRVSKTYKSGSGRLDLDPWWDYLWPPSTPTGAFSVRPSYEPDATCWPEYRSDCWGRR